MTKDEILTAVVREYDVPRTSIMSHCRTQPLAEARQMTMHLLHQEIHLPKSEIAQILCRHLPTVKYGIRRIRELLTVDKSVRGHYERIMNELRKEV